MIVVSNKHFISVFILIILGITVTSVYAAGRIYTNKSLDGLKEYIDDSNLNIQVLDSEYQVIESQYSEVLKQYNDSRKQTALIQNQLDRLNFDKAKYPKKKEQQWMAEKHQLQVEYYNVCLLIKQLSLAQSELEFVNKQILVEQEKLDQGDSTRLAVDDLISIKHIAQDKITNLGQSIDEGKSALKSRINEATDVKFDPLFGIPSTVDGSDTYSLSSLRKKCEDNNIGLLQINAYIGFHSSLISSLKTCVGESDPSYGTAVSERTKLQADANVLRQQIDSYVEQQYNNYGQCLTTYFTIQERKGILNRQLVVLKNKYDNGDISELQYLSEKFLVLKELTNEYSSIVDIINSKSMMNLIENGIILQNK